MTAFPALTPSARSWTPGTKPISTFMSMGGREIRFRHGTRTIGQRLTLEFTNVTEAVGKQITDHYEAVDTIFESFTVPAAVYGGMDGYDYIISAGNEWRYAGPPQVTYNSPGYQTVSVELVGVVAPPSP